MAKLKTKATKESVVKFLNSIEPKEKRADGFVLLKMFQKITGEKAIKIKNKGFQKQDEFLIFN